MGLLRTHFYFCMSLLTAAVVVFGFSFTVERKLLHPAVAPPALLYVHAFFFFSWLAYAIIQSGLIRTRNIRLHKRMGWFGAGLAVVIFVLGVATALDMARFNKTNLHALHVEADLIAPLFDMICFAISFALAIHYRKRPEFHRRLAFMASCVLTSAAFGRFPPRIMPAGFFYAGVDALICLGIVRDRVIDHRVHPVYVLGLPALILGQIFVMYVDLHESPAWLCMAKFILSLR